MPVWAAGTDIDSENSKRSLNLRLPCLVSVLCCCTAGLELTQLHKVARHRHTHTHTDTYTHTHRHTHRHTQKLTMRDKHRETHTETH